jgi:hypothetical protein
MKEIFYLLQFSRLDFPESTGKMHASDNDAKETYCGKKITPNWWITKVSYSYKPIKVKEVTCKACLKKIKEEDKK